MLRHAMSMGLVKRDNRKKRPIFWCNKTPKGLSEKKMCYSGSSLFLIEDKISMAHGLETRVPFMDNDLVDFATRIPVKYKLGKLNEVVRINENEAGNKIKKYFEKTQDGKLIMRKVMERYIPKNITEGVKQGFSAPDASWFKGDSIEFIKKSICSNQALIYNYFDYDIVTNLMNQHLEGKENRRLLIWSLLSLEDFFKNYIK